MKLSLMTLLILLFATNPAFAGTGGHGTLHFLDQLRQLAEAYQKRMGAAAIKETPPSSAAMNHWKSVLEKQQAGFNSQHTLNPRNLDRFVTAKDPAHVFQSIELREHIKTTSNWAQVRGDILASLIRGAKRAPLYIREELQPSMLANGIFRDFIQRPHALPAMPLEHQLDLYAALRENPELHGAADPFFKYVYALTSTTFDDHPVFRIAEQITNPEYLQKLSAESHFVSNVEFEEGPAMDLLEEMIDLRFAVDDLLPPIAAFDDAINALDANIQSMVPTVGWSRFLVRFSADDLISMAHIPKLAHDAAELLAHLIAREPSIAETNRFLVDFVNQYGRLPEPLDVTTISKDGQLPPRRPRVQR